MSNCPKTPLRMKQYELVAAVDKLIAGDPLLENIQSACGMAKLPKNVMLMMMLLNVSDLRKSAERALLQRGTII